MTDLMLSPKPLDALRGKAHVIIFGARAALTGKPRWMRSLGLKWMAQVPAIAAEGQAGGLGKVLATRPLGAGPKRLSVALLPDITSRHVSPSRAHAIASCADKAEIRGGEKTGVLLVLDEPGHPS